MYRAWKLSLPDSQEGKRWTNWKQWLFLDPSENGGHTTHCNPKIWGDRWIQRITTRIYLLAAEDVGATNSDEQLHSNFYELLEEECRLLWGCDTLGPIVLRIPTLLWVYLQEPHQVLKVNPPRKIFMFLSGYSKSNYFEIPQCILHKKASRQGKNTLPDPYLSWWKRNYPASLPLPFLSHLRCGESG